MVSLLRYYVIFFEKRYGLKRKNCLFFLIWFKHYFRIQKKKYLHKFGKTYNRLKVKLVLPTITVLTAREFFFNKDYSFIQSTTFGKFEKLEDVRFMHIYHKTQHRYVYIHTCKFTINRTLSTLQQQKPKSEYHVNIFLTFFTNYFNVFSFTYLSHLYIFTYKLTYRLKNTATIRQF